MFKVMGIINPLDFTANSIGLMSLGGAAMKT
jgi:hypothetical protein